MAKTRRTKKTKKPRGGSKQYRHGDITNINGKINGTNFFRKYGGSTIEHMIYGILIKNPHPNIVKVYQINDSYVDIEELKPFLSRKNYDRKAIVEAASAAKSHLQSLGIMYIDWKPDNMGIGVDGNYKLFDFDASGMVSRNSKKWSREPMPYWSYEQALAKGLSDPKEIDDYAFDIGFSNLHNEN
jgi:serine/threonine protein kinase